MIQPVVVPLGIDRAKPRVFRIRVEGVDLSASGTTWHAQIRLYADAAGDPVLDLPKVTDATVSGVRFVGLESVDGLPVSTLDVQIAGSATFPAAQAPSNKVALAWDMFVTLPSLPTAKWLSGDVIVAGTVTKEMTPPPLVALPTDVPPNIAAAFVSADLTLALAGGDALGSLVAAAGAARDQAITAVVNLPQGVWFSACDLSTMRQERTGAAATTAVAVGNPVGSWRNKGSKGGWATAPSDAARPILIKVGRFYRLLFDGVDDCLILPATAFDLSSIDIFIGGKFVGGNTDPGILTLAPAAGVDYNSDHGLSINAAPDGQIGLTGGGTGAGGPVLNMAAQGTMEKNARVIRYCKQNNSSDANLYIDNGLAQANSTETTFGLQTGDLIICARQGNGILGFGNHEIGEIVVSTATPAHNPNSIREHVELATYGPQPQYPTIADGAALTAARNQLITEVYAGAGIPTAVGTLALESPAPLNASASFPNLLKCEKMTIPGYAARPRLLTPTGTVRSDIIYLICAGHDASWMVNGFAQNVIQPLLTAGIRVCAFVLPDGPDDLTSGGPANHNVDQPPLKNWTGPVSIAINKLKADFPAAAIYMTGISGGGWTTMMCAALDTRIVKSYQCVGSLPDMIYVNRDYEQRLPGLTADYMTLYALAASPAPRRFMQILYENDPGGPFGREQYASRPPYDSKLTGIIQNLGGTYDLKWVNWYLHAFTAASAALLLAELP